MKIHVDPNSQIKWPRDDEIGHPVIHQQFLAPFTMEIHDTMKYAK